ncbi:hypothetical protein Tco_0353287 [Tanacetum coccineum]
MERFSQPTNDPLALVSNASNQKYPTQSSESPQSSNQPSLVNNCQMDTGSTSADNLIESLTNTLALLNQSYKSHLPQTNNQLRTSSNAMNKATVQDDIVVVQDVRVQTALFKEVKVIEEIFDQMNDEVDQNTVDKQCAEIVKKNLLIENENLIANCLSNQLLYDVEKSRCLDLEAEMSKVHNESKHISKLERECLICN